MAYYLDEDSTSLADLQARLEATDLVPSHLPLMDGIGERFGALERVGVDSIRELRRRLKNPKAIATLAGESGVEGGYLGLLRRVVEGLFPKPQTLAEVGWLDRSVVDRLAGIGIRNTEQLFDAVRSGPAVLVETLGGPECDLSSAIALSDLSRVQWVSPGFARVLIAAGYDSSAGIAAADPARLFEAVVTANEAGGFYRGVVGLRDIKRLVVAASYVPRD